MRTSQTQFILLVEYMERNGDLSKPTDGPQGRATNNRLWEEMTQLLNAESTGDAKTLDKWRKLRCGVTSKIIPKKKAAKIHKAAERTGGGPACKLKLTDMEQRVLNIIGSQAATGIVEVPEIGLEEDDAAHQASPSIFMVHQQIEQQTCSTMDEWHLELTSPPDNTETINNMGSQDNTERVIIRPLPPAGATQHAQGPSAENAERIIRPLPPAGATQHAQGRVRDSIEMTHARSPAFAHAALPPAPAGARLPTPPPLPTPLPPTPRRRRRRLLDHASPISRRTRTQTQSDLARQAFVRSDCEWRNFQQEIERERIRIRHLELAQQDRWLELFGQFVALGDRVVTILENK